MFMIYIAKAMEDFRLPVMHQIYEWFCQTVKQHKCAFDSLPSNASQVKPIMHMLFMPMYLSAVIHMHMEAKFWTEWNSFEIETVSGDTFHEMLCIKSSVQAQFSTAASYLVAKLRAQSCQTLSKMLQLH